MNFRIATWLINNGKQICVYIYITFHNPASSAETVSEIFIYIATLTDSLNLFAVSSATLSGLVGFHWTPGEAELTGSPGPSRTACSLG